MKKLPVNNGLFENNSGHLELKWKPKNLITDNLPDGKIEYPDFYKPVWPPVYKSSPELLMGIFDSQPNEAPSQCPKCHGTFEDLLEHIEKCVEVDNIL
jgi:hypothetical protein